MKTKHLVNKIAITQASFHLSGLITYFIIGIPLKTIIGCNIILTVGYLLGFWHRKV